MRLRAKTRIQGKGIAQIVIPELRGAAHYATDKATDIAKIASRSKVRSVGLGNLANAIGATSSAKKRQQGSGVGRERAWGAIYARGGRDSRANQALMSYTEGALIRPTGGRKWLAYPTEAAGRLARLPIPRIGGRGYGNFKNQPSRMRGLKLSFVRLGPNRAMLVLKNASVSRKTGRAKPAGKRLGRGADRRDFVVMFWLIRFTRRAARYSQDAIVKDAAGTIPRFVREYQLSRKR